MDREIARLEQQLERALVGGAWHGPAVLELLDGVTAEEAAARPIPGAHGIWELVLHLASDYVLVLQRLSGDGRPLTDGEGWPPCPEPTEESWRQAKRRLEELNRELRRAIRAFPAERLDEPLVEEVPYTAYTQLIGITQHALYHAGQIALLKRALRT